MFEEIQSSNIKSISDYSFMVHECLEFIFLSRVHIKKPDVKPKMDGDPINYIETLINVSNIREEEADLTQRLLIQKSGEEPAYITFKEFHFNFDLSEQDIDFLKDIFSKIINNKWAQINEKDLVESEKLLINILKSIRNSTLVEVFP